jgi:hypothetical protein
MAVWVAVCVGVTVGVSVGVAEGVNVGVDVIVAVPVLVAVAVFVTVAVCVLVAVFVGVAVFDAVGVIVAVGVLDGVGVGVGMRSNVSVMPAAVPPPCAGIDTVCTRRSTVTVTLLLLPSIVSMTLHDAPSGRLLYVCERWPATAPAGITKTGDCCTPLHVTVIWISPWNCAPSPAMVLVTTSEPVGKNSAVAVTVEDSVASSERISRWYAAGSPTLK